MIKVPKVDYGLFRAYALPIEQAWCQNDTFGTVIIKLPYE